MKIALTGATGHFGSALVEEMHSRGIKIKALIRQKSDVFKIADMEVVHGSILSYPALINLMDGCDALIHSAAVISIHGDPDGLVRQTNVEGVKMVIRAAHETGVKRMVHISSIHAFQQQPTFEMLNEDRNYVDHRAHDYDRSKLAGQTLVKEANSAGFETIIVNPTAMLGPPDPKPSLLGQAFIDLYKGKIPAIIEGGFDFCDTRDVAVAVVNALSMGKPGCSYLLGGKWYDMKTFVQTISKVSGKKINILTLPVVFAKAGLPFIAIYAKLIKEAPLYTRESLEALVYGNRMISSEKATLELKYQTRPFEDTMNDTFQWFLKNGYLK